ncbi:MAG: MerC domain-containing protein [Pseudomonadota bacterium]
MTAATPQSEAETTGESAITPATDRAAVALSLLCIVHCVALPALALALPVLAVVGEMEWVHWVFAVLAVLASGTVATTSPAARTPGFLIPAGLGASFVVFGLFAEEFGVEEAIPTVVGGMLLAFAHWRRLAG